MKATEENCRKPALATVDEQGEVRYLNRDEFELMKRLNPRLMEMKACGIVYLTEVPEIKKPPSLAVPKQTG